MPEQESSLHCMCTSTADTCASNEVRWRWLCQTSQLCRNATQGPCKSLPSPEMEAGHVVEVFGIDTWRIAMQQSTIPLLLSAED